MVHAWRRVLRRCYEHELSRTHDAQRTDQRKPRNHAEIQTAILLMLDLDTVKKDIEAWILNFCEVPHPALGNFPPCPYARSARLKNSYAVYLGVDPYYDLKNRARMGMGNKEVIIYAYDPVEWPHELFAASIESANTEHLLRADILALEDHPADIENVNGVIMNQGKYAMALVQGLSDLNNKARLVARKGFYDSWPEEYLTALFQHRQDPRQ